MPHPHLRAPARRTRMPRHALSIAAAIIAVSVATVGTLAGARFLAAERPLTAGAPRQPAATPTPLASPAVSPTPAPEPTATVAHPSPAGPATLLGEDSRGPRGDAALVALRLPDNAQAGGSPLEQVARVLAVSSDAELVASVGRFGGPGALHLTRRDGADRPFRIGPASGSAPIGAAFAPDASWLAVVTGSGELWRLDLATGRSSVISAGVDGMVFGMSVVFAPGGRLLVTQVTSVEMPMPSRLAAVDPDTGGLEVLSAQTGAYQPTATRDGAIVFFATRDDGTTEVRQLRRDGSESMVAALGETVWVDASSDGRHVAVERSDGRVVIVDVLSGRSTEVGAGARPQFSPTGDGISLLDLARGRARAVDLAGNEVAAVESLVVAWAECPEGCDS